ncbi:MAG: histidinol dehydrogenase [Gammaproteobacteria bacterium]|nr:histidinol dehydrogenase [Gammaproteobacteria bacterium]
MKLIDWNRLEPSQAHKVLRRPGFETDKELADEVSAIITAVRERGDSAVNEFTRRFDNVAVEIQCLPGAAFAQADGLLGSDIKAAIAGALSNIRRFHLAQVPEPSRVEVRPGVVCEKQLRALGTVGLYVPGGSASLPSTMLMLGVPSGIAGCPRRVLCTPPGKNGLPDPAILHAAALTGISEVFAVGGAQAIAAMAYGTESVPKVDKIFGPGNRWVTEAKQQVTRDPGGAGIDMPAGPSEVMVIADKTASAEFVAADLLSQAEHGPDSQVVVVTDSKGLLENVERELSDQLGTLSRQEIAEAALAGSLRILTRDLRQAVSIANAYAPEHLIINTREPSALLGDITSAGSVFLGSWSAEALGDYCSGTNHVLPTNGFARYLSGLSVIDFMRSMTVQAVTEGGLSAIGPMAITLARHEGLEAHARAVELRLARLARRASA